MARGTHPSCARVAIVPRWCLRSHPRTTALRRSGPPSNRVSAYGRKRPETVKAGRPAQYRTGGWIRYLMTTAGPEPMDTIESRREPPTIDYEHYLTRQLEPVADGILPFMGDSFARLTGPQAALF